MSVQQTSSLGGIYRRARNHSNTAIRRAKSLYFHQEASLLADPNCSPSTWWRVARKLCDLKGTPHVDMPPLLASSQKIVGSDSGKAELLNDTFISSNASLNQDAFPVCPSILSSVFTFDNICASDVSRALRSLPANRSSGPDEIPYQWDVFTKFRAKSSAGRTDWRAFQLVLILCGGRQRLKFGGPLWKENRAPMLCHCSWVVPGCSTKTDSCKFELFPARTECF